jgi:hypothetical protein
VVVDDATVGHSGDSKDSRTWWRLGSSDDPFLTETLQVHVVEIPAGKSNTVAYLENAPEFDEARA